MSNTLGNYLASHLSSSSSSASIPGTSSSSSASHLALSRALEDAQRLVARKIEDSALLLRRAAEDSRLGGVPVPGGTRGSRGNGGEGDEDHVLLAATDLLVQIAIAAVALRGAVFGVRVLVRGMDVVGRCVGGLVAGTRREAERRLGERREEEKKAMATGGQRTVLQSPLMVGRDGGAAAVRGGGGPVDWRYRPSRGVLIEGPGDDSSVVAEFDEQSDEERGGDTTWGEEETAVE